VFVIACGEVGICHVSQERQEARLSYRGQVAGLFSNGVMKTCLYVNVTCQNLNCPPFFTNEDLVRSMFVQGTKTTNTPEANRVFGIKHGPFEVSLTIFFENSDSRSA
jgi:hypothetical protein